MIKKTKRDIPKHDYLKYWKVVRYWAMRKWDLTQAELDMLLFLYSEGKFSRKQFDEYNNVLSWSKRRFKKLLDDGWVVVWRERDRKNAKLYTISYKGKRAMGTLYHILNGGIISESNQMFRTSDSYSDKVHRNYIKEINKERIENGVKPRAGRKKKED